MDARSFMDCGQECMNAGMHLSTPSCIYAPNHAAQSNKETSLMREIKAEWLVGRLRIVDHQKKMTAQEIVEYILNSLDEWEEAHGS